MLLFLCAKGLTRNLYSSDVPYSLICWDVLSGDLGKRVKFPKPKKRNSHKVSSADSSRTIQPTMTPTTTLIRIEIDDTSLRSHIFLCDCSNLRTAIWLLFLVSTLVYSRHQAAGANRRSVLAHSRTPMQITWHSTKGCRYWWFQCHSQRQCRFDLPFSPNHPLVTRSQ